MHPLPAPVDFGRIERSEDPLRCCESGHEISNGGTDLVWWSITRSGQVHNAGLALHDHIVAGSILLRPGIAEPGDRAIDHRRASRLHGLVSEAEPFHSAGPKVLNQHVA